MALSESGGERPGSKSYENGVVLLLALAGRIAFYDRGAISNLFPAIVPELHLQMWQVGVITSAMSLTQGLSGWIVGSTSDRIGRKTILVPAILVYSLLSWITGITTTFVQMVAARILVGLTGGPIYPISMAAVVEESSPTRRGINCGVIGASCTVAAFVVAPVIVVQLAFTVGWRWAFFVAGVPGLVIALLLWRFLRESQSFGQRQAGVGEIEELSSRGRYLDALGFRNIRLSAAYNAATNLFVNVFMAFAPLYLTQVQGLSMAMAGGVLASFGVGNVIGSIVVPAISDYIGRRPTMAVANTIMGLSLVGFLAAGGNGAALTVILFCGGLCAGTISVVLTAVMESVPINLAAGAISVSMLAGTVFGSTIMPIVAGALADRFGNVVPIYLATLGGFVGGVFALFFAETAPRALARRAGMAKNEAS